MIVLLTDLFPENEKTPLNIVARCKCGIIKSIISLIALDRNRISMEALDGNCDD